MPCASASSPQLCYGPVGGHVISPDPEINESRRLRSSTHVVNMAVVQPIGFSPHGEYLALSSPDGTLKIWDTESGTIRQEYTPSSHLSSTCSCLAWNPGRRTKVSRSTTTPPHTHTVPLSRTRTRSMDRNRMD